MNDNNKNKHGRQGLILLVVLGMLALFSLLAVTYVVFASQTRATSVAHTRRYVRETPSKPLIDDAVKQLIRGTNNRNSALFGHDMLGDLYGSNDTQTLGIMRTRLVRLLADTSQDGVMALTAGNDQRPFLLGGGRFLRIPIDPTTIPEALRMQDDSLTGRIVTFLEGQGPLSGQSFRVIRYIGNGSSSSTELASSVFSITIDLHQADLSRSHSQLVFVGNQRTSVSMTLAEWAVESPTAGHLCFDVNLSTNRPISGYEMVLNAVPLNGHGAGINSDGSSQLHRLSSASSADPNIRDFPVNLLPRIGALADSGSFLNPSSTNIVGDTDEPIDAADYNTMFLSYRSSSASEAGTIPSFHRGALLNYIINFKPFEQFTEDDFWATIRRIELATLTPLAIDIRSSNPNRNYATHTQFERPSIPLLRMDLPDEWDPNILLSDSLLPPQRNFRAWLTALIGGPWDVDNNNDGTLDSIWMDIGLPLQRTSDGKLLKALVSYYVDDLDGKLDINASGGTAQASIHEGGQNDLLYGSTANGGFNSGTVPAEYSPLDQSIPVWQGMGLGPGDVSFLHLFRKNFSTDLAAKRAYAQFMLSRYRPNANSSDWKPGASFWGLPSKLRHSAETSHVMTAGNPVFTNHYPGRLPGLPIGLRGRTSIVPDWLGNPFIWNYGAPISIENNEYEARLIAGSHADSPVLINEWERIYRWADADSTSLPTRLRDAFGEDDSSLNLSSLSREISPRNRHLLVPKLNSRARVRNVESPSSFFQLVNTIRRLKAYDRSNPNNTNPTIDDLSFEAFSAMFPLEFRQGRAMNLNRLFGNGLDDTFQGRPGFGEIDEPTELMTAVGRRAIEGNSEYALEYSSARLDIPVGSADFDPAYTDTTGLETRQLFARHLYCLAQLIVPDDYAFPNVPREQWTQVVLNRESNEANYRRFLDIRSRILAQWAVNVVDFRDADSVMTRFPYDPDPLDKLRARFPVDEDSDGQPDSPVPGWNPQRWGFLTVAWGMEQPELLLTESLAFHDLRIRRDPVANPDRFDQFRIPQGSLFLELYCPRSTFEGVITAQYNRLQGASPSLYETNDLRLNVSKLSPANDNGVRFPVWRIYISEPVDPSTTRVHRTPNDRMLNQPNSEQLKFDLTYQLPRSNRLQGQAIPPGTRHTSGLVFDHTGLLAGDVAQKLPEPDPPQARIVVFTPNFSPNENNSPGVTSAQAQVFTNNSNNNILLRGNQYLVIGPRDITRLGSLTSAGASPPLNRPSEHRIHLTNDWCELYGKDSSGNEVRHRTSGQGQVRPVQTMIAANVDRPTGWPTNTQFTQNFRVGLNVSEPLGNAYYAPPTTKVNTAGNSGFADGQEDGYFNYLAGGRPEDPTGLPFDDGTRRPLNRWDLDHDGVLDIVPEAQGVLRPGTHLDWCTAYLQRLADPNRAWDETLNPYITVDWIPIDLTLFSGEENRAVLDPIEPLRLASRQKCGQPVDSQTLNFVGSSDRTMNGQTFYSSLTHSPRQARTSASNTTFLRYEIVGDLYDTNTNLGTSRPSGANSDFQSLDQSQGDTFPAFATLGFLNSPFVLSSESGTSLNPSTLAMYRGGPSDPQKLDTSWVPSTLFWANRPFVNSLELSYVPLSSPGQLGQEFSASATSANESRYAAAYHDPTVNTRPTEPRHAINSDSRFPFSHLLNFFQEVPELIAPLAQPNPPHPQSTLHAKDTSLALLLDLVETPSPWADVEEVQPPSTLVMVGNTAEALATNAVLRPYRAPYNTILRWVEPGRVNLNSLTEANVLHGLISNTFDPNIVPNRRITLGSAATEFNALVQSRRGYHPASGNLGNVGDLEANSATALNANYPTQFAGMFKPVSEAGMVPVTRTPSSSVPTLQNLLSDGRGVLDLFSRRNPVCSTIMRPSFGGQDANGIYQASSKPAFQASSIPNADHPHALSDMYHISRLQKLVTERSNVFAVYVTVGLFDYDENSGIGREYGLDNGQNKRLRAFYVIDRSIPVGYRVGQDLNTENTILVRRILSE